LLLPHLHIYSKLKDTDAKNRELEEQLENMKKEMEESRSRSDKGENADTHVITSPLIDLSVLEP